MSKFKTIFLSVFKKIVDFISIVALILTVLSASLVIFYSEVVKIFDMFGWPQERLVWLTLTLGGLGTAGIAMSRISGGLNSALILAKSEQEINQKTFEKETNLRLVKMEQLYNKKIADIDDKALEKLVSVKKEITTQNKLLKKIDKFNEIQARKYLNASDRVIDKELKDQYQNFLEKHEE